MTTTIMKNSKVGDAWIMEACRANPIGHVIDPTTGQPTENISTGPVRLAFLHLLQPQAPQNNDGNAKPKYGVMAIYPPANVQNYQLLYNEYYRLIGQEFPTFYNQHMNPPQYVGLEVPFHDQATKMKYSGFTPGSLYINHTTQFRIPIVDSNQNPITDESRLYAGVWAILVVNPYVYGKSPPRPKKGASFGLQAVMIIGDDERLDGAGIDPRMAFAGAKVAPPAINPAALGGLVPAAATGLPGMGRPPVSPQVPMMPPGMPSTFPAAPFPAPLGPGMVPAQDDFAAKLAALR